MLACLLALLPGSLRLGGKNTEWEVPVNNRLYVRSNIPRLLIIGLALIMIAFISGISCQGSSPAPEPTPAPMPTPALEPTPSSMPATIELEIANFAFSQATITVPIGTTVTWYNKDSAPHTVTTREPLFDSSRLSLDENFSYTFNQSGTFEYYCTIHPYMSGKIIVE